MAGRDVEVTPRDRRSVTAWTLGVNADMPGPFENDVLPFGSVFFWRHPDEDTTLRAVVVGLYNDVFFARSTEAARPFELRLTFESLVLPTGVAEVADGMRVSDEELYWGYVRPGVGIGWRRQVAPGEQDNMLSFGLNAEPGFVYFEDSSDTADDFTVPQDTFEPRLHFDLRWDAFRRNLLELPHEGLAAGADLIYGYRANWEDWGSDSAVDASSGRDFLRFMGYLAAAGGVPAVDSERHRLLGTFHFGTSTAVDRFSAQRVGGGPHGTEYGTLWRPILPGAALEEFFPDHYAVAVLEYRWEPIFFSYLSAQGAVGYFDRDRVQNGVIVREDDFFAALGGRLTTGFIGELHIVVEYNYNFSVVRDGDYGGHQVVFQVSRQF